MSILDLSFNDNASCLVVGHNSGFVIYSLKPTLSKNIVTEFSGGIGKARILRLTNILGLVGGGDDPYKSKDTVIIWNQHKKTKVLGIELNDPVKNLYVINKQIIIVLEKRICVAALNNGDIKYMQDTYANENGLCKYSYKNDSLVIVTLGSKKGEIGIWKLQTDVHSVIQAHSDQHNVSALAINEDGSLVASASESGNNIHVYNTDSGTLLYKLRRGTSEAKIYDICFDIKSTQIVCTSDKGTVHIWDLTKSEVDVQNKKSVLSGFKDYLPEYFDSNWSKHQISIGDISKNICAFDEENIIHIASMDGNYFRISEKDGVYNQLARTPLYINQCNS
jgi:WD40 repeat protein